MKTFTLTAVAIVISFALYSQGPTTISPGDISGIWTLAGSPYYLVGNNTVPDGLTLTIEPGVVVEWQDSKAMFIQGRILAEGTATDSIIFTAKYDFDGFKGIRFDNTPLGNDTSRFTYCAFRYGRVYGEYPDNNGGAIATRNYSKVNFDHCLFAYNKAIEEDIGGLPSGGAIALWTSSPVIQNCTFKSNESLFAGAIMCWEDSDPKICNNLFVNNVANSLGGAIMCYHDSDPTIDHNLFYNNSAIYGGAIELWRTCSPLILNNTIADNFGSGGAGGIDIMDTCCPIIKNNIIWGNTGSDGPQVYIGDVSCEVNFNYSDVEGGEEEFGGEPSGIIYEDNIDEDPLFLDPSSGNYCLERDASPCIDAGDPDPIYNDPDGSQNDMGSWWPSCYPVGILDGFKTQDSRLKVQCFPNPTSGRTDARYRIPVGSYVIMNVYDVHGQLIRELISEEQQAGEYQVRFDASDLPSGIYLILLQVGNKVVTEKIVKL